MTKTDVPHFTPKGILPTGEQSAIQTSKNKVVIVQANAGAAKTTTLALRIGEALARRLDPELILALTFTPEARDVLKERLVEIGIPRTTVARMRIFTFEDFSRSALELIELRKLPPVLNIKELKQYADMALQNASDKYADKLTVCDTSTPAFSQFFHTQLELKATMRLCADFEELEEEDISNMLGVAYSTALTILEYERIRLNQGNHALFRGPFDATYDLACRLEADVSVRTLLPRYRIILCDELHDLNEAAFRILVQLIDPAFSYFIGAGDSDQVIYSRLGASEKFMRTRFQVLYPATASYPLTNSFRHGPHLAYSVGAFKKKPADSLLTLHTEIRQVHYEDGNNQDCADQVVQSVLRWKEAGHDLDRCTILLRDSHQAIEIENALMRAAISYRTLEMTSYLDRTEILFLRGVIAIGLNDISSIEKNKRGDIFDALVTFAEISFSSHEDIVESRKAVIEVPGALNWLFTGRNDQPNTKNVADKVRALVDDLRGAVGKQAADDVLGGLRQQLAGLLGFARAATSLGRDTNLARAVDEAERQITTMTEYLESSVKVDAETLLRAVLNMLLTLWSTIDQMAARDVKERMKGVMEYLGSLSYDSRAHLVLDHICSLMNIEALAKRLYIHPHEARVVTKSIAGFIGAARVMDVNLREFADWLAGADQHLSRSKHKKCVFLDCVRNVKGKEFDHVIMPHLEEGQFPFERADRKEEDNLFYVAITRAVSSLTLISPHSPGVRSSFIQRMQIDSTHAKAEAALRRNERAATATARIEFIATGDDWAVAKGLGAHWDSTRKIFYLKPGQDPTPFRKWIGAERHIWR